MTSTTEKHRSTGAEDFDVFLSYNSEDKAIAAEVYERLKARGVRVWWDARTVDPGEIWQKKLEAAVPKIDAAIVFVGPAGLGTWQKTETRVFLNELTQRELRIIPVLLTDAGKRPELPILLQQFSRVELDSRVTEEDVERLVKGIFPDKDVPRIESPPKRRRPSWRWAVSSAALAAMLALAGGWLIRDDLPEEEPPPRPAARSAVAALNLENLSQQPDAAWLSTALAEILTLELELSQEIQTLDREEVAVAQAGLDLEGVSSPSAENLERLRSSLGAEYVVAGSYTLDATTDSLIRIQLTLFETSTGRSLASGSGTGNMNTLFSVVGRAARPLREALGLEPSTALEKERLAASFPNDPEAARLYSEGLRELRGFEVQAARGLLEQAVGREPASPRPYLALAKAWAYLGYLDRAQATATAAVERSGPLPEVERGMILATSHAMRHEWDEAIEIHRGFFDLFPGEVKYGLLLAETQTEAGVAFGEGHADRALETLAALRDLPLAEGDPRIDLAEADAHLALHQYEEAAAAAEEAAEKAQALGARHLLTAAQFARARALFDAGEPQAAAALAEAAAGYEELGRKDQLAQCLEYSAMLQEDSHPETSRSLYGKALEIYSDLGFQRGRANTLAELASFLWKQGELEQSRSRFETVAAIYREIGAELDGATIFVNLGAVHHLQGDLEQALDLYVRALRVFDRPKSDNPEFAATVITNIAEIRYVQGDLEEALNLHNEAHALDTRAQSKANVAYDTFRLAKVFAARGDTDVARSRYREALELQTTLEEDAAAAETRAGLAELEFLDDKAAAAETLAGAAEQVLRALDADLQVIAAAVQVRALLAQGRKSEAAEIADRIRSILDYSEDFRVRNAGAMAVARMRAASGDSGEVAAALADLGKIVEETGRSGLVLYALEARLAMGEIELLSGRETAGHERLADLADAAKARGFGLIAKRALKLSRDSLPSSASSRAAVAEAA